MTDKLPIDKKGFSADWLLQGALTRIGDTVDRVTGRRWTPSSSLATSELIERMKLLLESEAKHVEGKGTVVPHNIKLKVQWDKFSTDADGSLLKLENELLTAAADYINDKLYYTHAPLKVEVKLDYFTEGVKLFVSFDKFSDQDHEAELNVTIPSIPIKEIVSAHATARRKEGVLFIARFKLNGSRSDRKLVFPENGRLAVGRTVSNDLMIDDISVSKLHASLVVDAEFNLSVADIGSTNGTFVNDERIAYGRSRKLGKEDTVKFGMVEVVFEHIAEEPDDPADDSPVSVSKADTVEIGGFEFTSKVSIEKHSDASEIQPAEKTLEIDPLQTAGQPTLKTNIRGEQK